MDTPLNHTHNLPLSNSGQDAVESSTYLKQNLDLSLARIRHLLASLPQIVWIAQVNGEITEFNQRWHEYTGLSPVQSLIWGFLQALHPEERDRYITSCDVASKNLSSYEFECRILGVDGTYRWFQAQTTPVIGTGGEILELVGTYTLKAPAAPQSSPEANLASLLTSLSASPTLNLSGSTASSELQAGETSQPLTAANPQSANLRLNKANTLKIDKLTKHRVRNLLKELSHTIFWEAEATTEQYTFVSESAERVLGYPVQQWTQEPDFWIKLIHPEDRQWTVALCRKEMGHSRDYELEYRCVAADNRVVWLRDRAYVVRDDQGQVHKRRGLMVDITLAKQAEAQLHTLKRQQAVVAQLSQQLLASSDAWQLINTGITLVSQALAVDYCQVLELLPESNQLLLRAGVGWQEGLVEQTAIDASPKTHAGYTLHCRQPVVLENLCQERRFHGSSLLHDHHVVSGLSVIIDTTQNLENLEATSEQMFAHPFGILGIYTSQPRTFSQSDVDFVQSVAHVFATAMEYQRVDTALQEARTQLTQTTTILNQTQTALEKRTKELEHFAYVASHDLKAPLRAIANLSQWIEEDISEQLDEENLHQLQLLRGRVHRLEGLIEGLLQYSRAGRLNAKPEWVDTTLLLRQVIDAIQPPPQFTIEIAPGMPCLLTERLPLQLVFTHLIENAIKHHPTSAGTVRINFQEQSDAYQFAVEDNGAGIAPQFHERVFVIFQTLKSRDQAEHTGIGLAIVKKLIETKGGIIQLESQEGHGAKFAFTWPKLLNSSS